MLFKYVHDKKSVTDSFSFNVQPLQAVRSQVVVLTSDDVLANHHLNLLALSLRLLQTQLGTAEYTDASVCNSPVSF